MTTLTIDHFIAAMKLMPKPLPDIIICSPGKEDELLDAVSGLKTKRGLAIQVQPSEFVEAGQVFTIVLPKPAPPAPEAETLPAPGHQAPGGPGA